MARLICLFGSVIAFVCSGLFLNYQGYSSPILTVIGYILIIIGAVLILCAVFGK